MGLSGGVASLFTYPYVRDADWFAAGVPPYGNLYEYQRKQDTMTDLPQSLPQAWRPPMGWNSWDSYGTTLTEDELLANARFMAEHLKNAGWDTLVIDIDWYDPTARAHGYNDNAPLILDEYGRQLPDPVRFPSAAGGKGFGPLAAAVHELGLKLGMHMMRGIPRIAVDKNLPVYGTNYTAKDVADLDHVCKWNPDNYGLNQSHPGAQAWYDAVGPLGRHLPAVRPPGPLGAVPDHRPLGRRRHGAVRAHRPARRTRRRPPIPPYAGRAEDTAGPMVHGA